MADRTLQKRPAAFNAKPTQGMQDRLPDALIEIAGLRQENARLRIEMRRLLKEAHTDTLTGIFNRAGLAGALNNTFDKKLEGAVILIDLDKFKLINDTYGHDVGDEALQLVAKTLQDNVRKNDIVARYGGDEFIVIFEGMTPKEAESKLEQLEEKFDNLFLSWAVDEVTHRIKVGASLGMATYGADDDIEAVKKLADSVMYRKKNAKGNPRVDPRYRPLKLHQLHV